MGDRGFRTSKGHWQPYLVLRCSDKTPRGPRDGTLQPLPPSTKPLSDGRGAGGFGRQFHHKSFCWLSVWGGEEPCPTTKALKVGKLVWRYKFHSSKGLASKKFLDWVIIVEDILEFKEVPKNKWVPLIATRFRGQTTAWWQQVKWKRRSAHGRSWRNTCMVISCHTTMHDWYTRDCRNYAKALDLLTITRGSSIS